MGPRILPAPVLAALEADQVQLGSEAAADPEGSGCREVIVLDAATLEVLASGAVLWVDPAPSVACGQSPRAGTGR
jgi:hypothetical protein